MNSLVHEQQPVRSVLRSTAVLALALGLTVVVLAALATVVDSWA